MTSSRARRPVLPVLTAVLAGALVAGAATLVSSPAPSSTNHADLNLAVTDAPAPDQRGAGLARPELGESSTAPTSSAPPTSSTSAPPSSTTSAPPPSSGAPTASPTGPADPPPVEPEPEEPPPSGGSERDQVVAYVNWVRDRHGCDPVQADSRLTAAAQGHSADMSARDYFSHTTPEGVTFGQRIRNAGYPSPGAENIARGARSAEDVMEMWMRSDDHRANILNCRLNAIGVGLDTDGWYWTQDFGY